MVRVERARRGFPCAPEPRRARRIPNRPPHRRHRWRAMWKRRLTRSPRRWQRTMRLLRHHPAWSFANWEQTRWPRHWLRRHVLRLDVQPRVLRQLPLPLRHSQPRWPQRPVPRRLPLPRPRWPRRHAPPAWPRPAVRPAARPRVWRPAARRRPALRRPPLPRRAWLPARPDALPPASRRHVGRRARPASGPLPWLPAWPPSRQPYWPRVWRPAARRQPALRPAQPPPWLPRDRRRAVPPVASPRRRRPVRPPRDRRRPARTAGRAAAPWHV